MSEQSYRYNSHWMPQGFPHDFDAHIYFAKEQIAIVQNLRAEVLRLFNTSDFHIGDIIVDPIGPHPLPMFEVNFSKTQFGLFVPWLSIARGPLNVLVHPQSGDDYFDHTQGAIWLGAAVDINLSLF